jgi:hypothetical protein
MEIKFRIQKYSKDFTNVGTDYNELTNSILVDQYVSVSWTGYNFDFTNIEFRGQ